MRKVHILFIALLFLCKVNALFAFEKPDTFYNVFQFPQNSIPRIDGEFMDWELVPDSFAIGLDQLMDTEDRKSVV